MKVLLLTDAQFKALRALTGWDEIASESKAPKLPTTKELHRMARNGETPEVFEHTRERLEAANDAADDMRMRMRNLLVAADEVGVKPGALARWSGLSARRVHQITRQGES